MSEENAVLGPQARTLIEKFASHKAAVAIVGMGYVGLPLAVVLAEAGYQVIGIDLDSSKADAINRGNSYVEDVPSERLKPLIENKRFWASTDFSAIGRAEAVSICVPTPLRKTGDPDLSYIVSAAEAVAPHLHPGMVVVLESTTYPGTTRELVMPELEKGGLKIGEDFFLAFSPERVDPGRLDWTTENTPKVIGGITPACTQVAAAYYGGAMARVVTVTSTEVAEMAKLLENTFRAVNIGLVNEMALMCHRLHIDVWEVIEAAASKPFGFMKFTPGPGLGGHCIPIDPLYLSWKLKSVKYNARFIELASEINTNMPRYVVSRIQDALNEVGQTIKGSNMLILGVAYKPNIKDTRESPALDVIGLLQEKGARVSYYDPFVPRLADESWSLQSIPDLLQGVEQADCVVIVTDHKSVDYQAVGRAAKLVFDTRNAMARAGASGANVIGL
jgi:UDP-N-acetyl-D-glucosamine dehydrogenase